MWSVTTADNPSIEHQDGSRELLVLDRNGRGLISKSNWLFTCTASGKVAKSPSGLTYYFDEMVTIDTEVSWLVTRIVDRNGNEINLTYQLGSTARGVASDYRKLLTTVTASDGRVVNVTYQNTASGYYTHIESNGQVWTYLSEQVDGALNTDIYYLKEVTRPDGLKWQYSYNPPYGDGSTESGSGALTQISYPHGATSNFTYDRVQFDNILDSPLTTVVSSKSVSGPDLQSGSWTYTYQPRSVPTIYPDVYLDKTIVTTPTRVEHFQHYGYGYAKYNLNMLWAVGLLYKHQIFDRLGSLYEETVYDWNSYRIISDENFFQGRGLLDEEVRVAQLIDQYVWRDGAGYNTYYSNYDAFGNPGTIVRDSPIAGVSDHVTNNIYLNDESLWTLGLVVSSIVDEIGTTSYDYDSATRNLLSETAYGLTTTYTYDAEGNLSSTTNPKGQTVYFEGYYRGTARQETHPEGVLISRTVNAAGTVASYTDGEGITKYFTYDPLNRIESITYPMHDPVTFSYGLRTKTLTRGNLAVDRTLDGYGREIEIATRDTITGQSIVTNYRYDSAGNRVFTSLPNSLSGTTYDFDALGRNIKATNPDATSTQTIYESPTTTKSVGEDGNTTTYLYNFYGQPDFQRELIEVETPERQITSIQRNKPGQIVSISQGTDNGDGTFAALQRTYGYDNRYMLVSATHPEIGTIKYTRDDLGNVLTKAYGSTLEATYNYDQLNRVTAIDYSSSDTSDVTNTYDQRGLLVSTTNEQSQRIYSYDDNENLIAEQITIRGLTYDIGYEFDANDNLATITYPSGLAVNYAPDALGRPTRAGEFASAIDYFPSGAIHSITYGNGIVDTYSINQRLMIDGIQASNSAVDLAYSYNSNLTTASVINNLNHALDVNLTYDGDMRLSTVSGQWGAEIYTYDGQGNVATKTVDTIESSYSYFSGLAYDIDDFYKREYVSYSYDTKGNVTYINAIPLSLKGISPPPAPVWEKSFFYNSISQLKYARRSWNSGSSSRDALYDYGPAGNLVYRKGAAEETRIVVSQSGMHMGEYVGIDPYAGKENIYIGSKLIATSKNNHTPIIETEPDRTVLEGQNTTLSANVADVDGSVVGTLWTQTGGDPVSFTDDGTSVSFTVPGSSEGSVYTFQLEVTDDLGGVSYQEVTVTVAPNTPPVADAGPDQTALAGTRIELDGSASTDLEGIAGYQWVQTLGTPVYVSNAAIVNPSFYTSESLPDDETITFELTVTDTKGLTATDTVDINVVSVIKDIDADGLPDYWEIQYFGTTDAEPFGDPDGDGLTNVKEFAEGTDPLQVTQPGVINDTSVSVRKAFHEGMHSVGWGLAKSAVGYNLYWGYSSNLTRETANKVVTKSNSATIFEPLNNSTIYVMVEAYNASGVGPLTAVKPSTARTSSSVAWNLVSPYITLRTDPDDEIFSSSDRGEWIVAQVPAGVPAQLELDGYGRVPPAPTADVSGFNVKETRTDMYQNASVLLKSSAGDYVVLAYRKKEEQWSGLLSVGARTGETVSSVIVEDTSYNSKAIYYWVDSLTGQLAYQEYCFSCPSQSLSEPVVLDTISEDLRNATQLKLIANDYGKGLLAWSSNPGGDPASAYLLASYLIMDLGGNLTFSTPQQISAVSVKGGNTAEFSIIGASFYGDQAVLVASEDSSKTGDASQCFESVYDASLASWGARTDLDVCNRSGIRRYRSNSRGDSVFVYSGLSPIDVYANIRNSSGSWFESHKLEYGSASVTSDAIMSADAAVLEDGTVHVSWVDGDYATSIYFAFFRRIDYSPAMQAWSNASSQEFTPGANLVPKSFVMKNRLDGVVCGVYYGQQYNPPSYWLDIGYLYSSSSMPNSAPTAVLAAEDIVVAANGPVSLEVAATDVDGSIVSYFWQQTEGPAVLLNTPDAAISTFTAPDTSVDQVLGFSVTVTDNDGDRAVENVTVNVTGHGLDADPPVTQITASRAQSQGSVSFDITLTASEPGTTYFRLTGQGSITAGGAPITDWQEYTGQVAIDLDKNGIANFDYYSVDLSGNQETAKTEILQ